jgi:hypothetical protein
MKKGHSHYQTKGGLNIETYHNKDGKLIYVEIQGKGNMNENGNENFWGFPGLLPDLDPSFRGCGNVMVYKFERDEDEGVFRNGYYSIKYPTDEKTEAAICYLADDLVKKHEEDLIVFKYRDEDDQSDDFLKRSLEIGALKINSEYKWLEDVVNLNHFDAMPIDELDNLLERIAFTLIRRKAIHSGYSSQIKKRE